MIALCPCRNKEIYGRGRAICLMAFVATLISCAPKPDDHGYAKYILERPAPEDEASASRECDFLFREIDRQKAIEEDSSSKDFLPETALAIQKATQINIAALKHRANQLACPPPDRDRSDR
jgi:hypothetical protein